MQIFLINIFLLLFVQYNRYGGYDLIGNGGDLRHALTDLTGAPSETFILEEYLNSFKDKDPLDELWEKLKKADISRHIIGACSKSFSQIAYENLELFKAWSEKNKDFIAETFSMHQFGIYPSSCYTLIGVQEIKGVRLVRLRNP